MSPTRTVLLAVTAATAVTVVAGAALSGVAAGSSAPPTVAESPATPALWAGDTNGDSSLRDRVRARLAERLLHGEIVVAGRDGEPVTLAVQRGTIRSVGETTLVVRSDDGFEVSWRLDDRTRVFEDGSPTTLDGLAVGATVAVLGTSDTSQREARAIRVG